MQPLQCFDNTKVSAYKDCPRKFFLRHVKFWRAGGTAMPLVFGGAWHAAMDVVWRHHGKVKDNELVGAAMAAFDEKWTEEGLTPIAQLDNEQLKSMEPRTPEVAERMLDDYITDRKTYLRDCEVIQIEQPFAVPLPNLDAWYVGRLDKVVQFGNNKMILEHKTTAVYRISGGFDMAYLEGWYMDGQITGYQYGGNLYHSNLDGVWVDCSLVHKKVSAFKFVPVNHSFDIIKEWLNDTERWVENITRDLNAWDQHGELTPGMFQKNTNACYGKFGSCSFLDICRTTSYINKAMDPPYGYVVEEWNPFETLGLDQIINGGNK